MSRLMIVVGSVRPGRIGLPIAEWVRERAVEAGLDVDFADLKEIGLPLMDEANHPVVHQYEHRHTLDWSARVEAADAFVFVTPEYNHAASPALANAIDYLFHEWKRKPVAFVSYGGVSGGTRGVVNLMPRINQVGLIRTLANVELPFAKRQLVDGAFVATEPQQAALSAALDEIPTLVGLHHPFEPVA